MQNKYKDLIFTNHALERMRERGIKQGDVWATWKRPDSSRYSKTKGAYIYYKTFPTSPRLRGAGGNQKVEVVAKKNERGEWVVLSVWNKVIKKSKNRKVKTFFEKLLGK